MKKSHLPVLVFAILLLFLIQSAGTLVESIYILDLLNTSLDEKALGILFFFSPLLLLPFFRRFPRGLGWALFGLLFLGRGLTATLPTAGRLVSAGLAAGAAFGLLLLLQPARLKGEERPSAGSWAAGLALAVGLSALLRAAGNGIEYSLTPGGAWVGWLLGGLLGLALAQVEWTPLPAQEAPRKPVTAPLLGIYLVIILTWFAFSAPAVIARWTQGNYVAMVVLVSLLSLGWVWLSLSRPGWVEGIPPRLLLDLEPALHPDPVPHLTGGAGGLPAHPAIAAGGRWAARLSGSNCRVCPCCCSSRSSSSTCGCSSGKSSWQIPPLAAWRPASCLAGWCWFCWFSSISSPTSGRTCLRSARCSATSTGCHSSCWQAVSACWRGRAELPVSLVEVKPHVKPDWSLPGGLAVLLLATLLFAVPGSLTPPNDTGKTSLVAMTYNTQQFNTADGEKSADQQIALIRQASPDILALQESDSARISFNNNDYVRYFAEKLGYYAYYGPTQVTGTFGTAILSRYPLENPRSVFIYSDNDETGVAEAEVVVGGRRFTIYDVHPDGSDPQMLLFAQTVLARASGKPNVIVLGDFNLRDTEAPYQLFDATLVNAWTSVYPSKISPDGVDMSGRNRIDHIFTTPDLTARNPRYILPPASYTDHPVHWTELSWIEP